MTSPTNSTQCKQRNAQTNTRIPNKDPLLLPSLGSLRRVVRGRCRVVRGERQGWRDEDVCENGLELAEYDSRDCKVTLKSVHFIPEQLWQTGHVCPFLHLLEEVYEAVMGK